MTSTPVYLSRRQKLFVKMVAEQTEALKRTKYERTTDDQCPDCGVSGYSPVNGCAYPQGCCGYGWNH